METLVLSIGIIATIAFIIRPILTNALFNILKKTIPPISNTEKEAIDAGTVSYEKGIFAGKPDWKHLLNRKLSVLSDEEKAFLDGPVKIVTDRLNDYSVRKNSDLPPDVWQLLKDYKFFSFLIPKKYGGLEFSAQAISQIVSTLSSKSVAAGVTVMVPNSLGPGKLLLKFGTDTQKNEYLPKLASGELIPCFALTGVTSGSDAANMRDVGIIKKIKKNGRDKLIIQANFSKRYITLAPVANLIGLAFDLYDPDGLLGADYPYTNSSNKHVGITVALLNRNQDGIEIGNRHMPSGSGFMNGSIRGRDVCIDFEQVIGGIDYFGRGWMMLMASLGVGRSVSMPAVSTAGMSYSVSYTMLYAGMRKQFSIPIAKMEGVMEKLSENVYLSFINESARNLAASCVDDGENPAVSSALMKYASTEDMRTSINNCMDVLAGKAICDGPTNIIQGAYQSIPVGITVEGANILTRTLITFSQGAIRAHPFLLEEIESLYEEDEKLARKNFSRVITKHAIFTMGNGIANLWHNVTRGLFMPTPRKTHAPSLYYRMINLQAKQFALLSDVILLIFGGGIKSKQIQSGRLADVLKNIYYAMATLKRFEDMKNEKILPILDYSIRRLCYDNIRHMHKIVDNLPIPASRFILKPLLFPLSMFGFGLNDHPPKDKQALKMTHLLYDDLDLMRDVFSHSMNSGLLDDMINDYQILLNAEPIYQKLKPALKSGQITHTYDSNWCDDAYGKKLITKSELGKLKNAENVYYNRMNVDEFKSDDLSYTGALNTNITP